MRLTIVIVLLGGAVASSSNIESDQICDEIEAEQAIIELHDDLDDDDDGTISTTGLWST